MTDKAVQPADAATMVLLRDDSAGGVSAFFVERAAEAKFMGGHVVFPGGRVDVGDRDARWEKLCNGFTDDRDVHDEEWRAHGVAACRESLEEAAILPVVGTKLENATLLALRAELEKGTAFLDLMEARGLALDLGALHPFGRWVTPKNQSKRFDTRFFVARAPEGQEGAHDAHETVASFWAKPQDVLARHDAGAVTLAPPTHRVLEILAQMKNVDEVFAHAARASLEIICPEVVRHLDARGESVALTLPGDPEHSVREVRVPGTSRYVMRDGRWRPEPPPASE